MDCTSEASQTWKIEGLSVISLHDNRCLTYNTTDSSVGMSDCPEEAPMENQSWAWADGKLITKVDNKCFDYDSDKGKVKMKECEDKPDQKFYFENLGIYYNEIPDMEMAPDSTLVEYDNIHTCREECYSRMDCCGFTVKKNGKCALKNSTSKCAPLEERDGANSYSKTGDVSNLYSATAGLQPDIANGAAKLSKGVLTGKEACMAECYKDKSCCGFVELPDGTCQTYKKCDPLEPAFGNSFNEKTTGETEKMTVSLKCDGLAGPEVADVPWFACESGIYKTTEGKMMQCGAAEVQNTGGEWTEVTFHKDFPGAPVLMAYSMTRDGGSAIRARVKEISASKFSASLEMPGSSGVDDSSTALEKIGWLAIEAGKGVIGGKKYVAEEVSGVDAESGKFEFPSNHFTAAPKILAGIASADGTSTVGLRLEEISTEAVEIRLESDKDDEVPAPEKVGLFALEAPSMGGSTISASPLSKGPEDNSVKDNFEAVIYGKIIAPSSDATMAGPFKDTKYCLKTCTEEDDCCGVITVPAGLCWLKSKKTGDCSQKSVYSGAESYKKKEAASAAASLLAKGIRYEKRAAPVAK